jgi:hypothetical protein
VNLFEIVAAVLVALAAVIMIIAPLTQPGLAVPSAADDPEEIDDTPKGIALAALREIEFDKATGKLSDEDYAQLKTRYTAAALEVLRSDASPERAEPEARASAEGSATGDVVEAMIADRVRRMEHGSIRCPNCGPRPESDALFCSGCGRSLTVGGCAGCGAPLVPGSRFCEACGAAVAR